MSSTAAKSSLPFLLAPLAFAVAALAISGQSLWIDEAQTALLTAPGTLRGLWDAAWHDHSSNMQMPLYMLWEWAWVRLFGMSEVAMRTANIPFCLLEVFAIFHFLRRRPAMRLAVLLVFCLHPFVWYYLGEARPYAMQLCGAMLVAGAMFEALDMPEDSYTPAWWSLLALGLVILCGSAMLGVPWALGCALVLLLEPRFRKTLPRQGLAALAWGVPALAALAAYYAWTIKSDIRTGYLQPTAASMGSVFYEQLGFLGLGPGRATLRASSIRSLAQYAAGLALLGLPLAAGLLLAARRRFDLPARRLVTLGLLTSTPTALIWAAGLARHARILARHLTPLFPFVLGAEACAVLALWRCGRLGRGAAVVVIAALAVSSLQVRFAYRHSKDDFRSAAAEAQAALARGDTVWWAAASEGAVYYKVPTDAAPGHARWVDAVPREVSRPPDEIILSKPDLYDPTGSISRYIDANHYHVAATYQAFTVWRR